MTEAVPAAGAPLAHPEPRERVSQPSEDGSGGDLCREWALGVTGNDNSQAPGRRCPASETRGQDCISSSPSAGRGVSDAQVHWGATIHPLLSRGANPGTDISLQVVSLGQASSTGPGGEASGGQALGVTRGGLCHARSQADQAVFLKTGPAQHRTGTRPGSDEPGGPRPRRTEPPSLFLFPSPGTNAGRVPAGADEEVQRHRPQRQLRSPGEKGRLTLCWALASRQALARVVASAPHQLR